MWTRAGETKLSIAQQKVALSIAQQKVDSLWQYERTTLAHACAYCTTCQGFFRRELPTVGANQTKFGGTKDLMNLV